MYICIYIYIYIYILYRNIVFGIESQGAQLPRAARIRGASNAANLRTQILDFRGLDSYIILNLRVGIIMSTGSFPESLSQAILAWICLVGRLGVLASWACSLHHAALKCGAIVSLACTSVVSDMLIP